MSILKKLAISLAATSLLTATSAMAGDLAGVFNVELNQTEVVRLSEPAAAIIVGNPKIADISVHSSDTIFVLGRGYGRTNLIVLNAAGQSIMDADVQVVSATGDSSVRLYSGSMRSTYNCAPYCLPAPVLGDDLEFISLNTPETREINTTSISGPSSAPQSIVGMSVSEEPDFGADDPRRPYFPE